MYKRLALNILKTILVPISVFIIMDAICLLAQGRHIFTTALDIRNYIRTSCISFTAAMALSFNLTCGRFDLSLGGQRLVAVIIGGNIAVSLGLGSLGVLVVAVVFGALSGLIVGLAYTTFKLPALILGIAATLIYECICFAYRINGLLLHGVSSFVPLAGLAYPMATVAIAVLIISILLQYTRFGYSLRAISGSEQISRASGINITANTLGCYALGGGVVALSGVFDAAYRGRMTPTLGFASTTSVLTNCFPVFLGQYMSKWTNLPIGVLFATLAVKIFTTALAVLKFSANIQQSLELIMFLVYLVFNSNQDMFKIRRAKRQRVSFAKESQSD